MKRLFYIMLFLSFFIVSYAYTVKEITTAVVITDSVKYYSFNDEDVIPVTGTWEIKQVILENGNCNIEYIRYDKLHNVVEKKRLHDIKLLKLIDNNIISYGVQKGKNMPLIISYTVPSGYVNKGYYINISY